jgi:hypothetical protein
MARANRLGLELHQVDIKGAYLNGVLNEDEVLCLQNPLVTRRLVQANTFCD